MTAANGGSGPGAVPGSGPTPVWRPFALRAAAAALFGALTIFWQEPSVHVLSIAGGAYLLAVGAGVAWTAREAGPAATRRPAALAAAGVLGAAGLLNLVQHAGSVFAWSAAPALVAAGLLELVSGLRARRSHPSGNDLVLVGAVSAATGAALPFVLPLGAHALLGVTGGGALLTAVVLGLAALTYRQGQIRTAPEDHGVRAPGDAVN